ncbi:MAG TPA: spore coat U domain-containing protein [Candidatus Binatia bacterium]|nr:spore coat U domain-containing protein [Candidatus Binatia bacterium]
MKRALAFLLLAAGLLPRAHAAGSCSLSLTSSQLVDFGTYTSAGPAIEGSGALSFLCVPDILSGLTVPYSISIGAGGSGSFGTRRLSAGGYWLNYNLYTSAARNVIWGDGTAGTSKVNGSCATLCTVQVFGRLPAGQSVPGAQYSDSVVVTIDF